MKRQSVTIHQLKVWSGKMIRRRILIVDDEEAIRSILSDLMEYFGYECETAAGGMAALELVKQEPFNLIITDINMPDMNGLELIKQVKQEHPETDLIAVTGFDMEYRYTDVIEVGASDFIVKPFQNNELQAKIRRVFRERDLVRTLERLSERDSLTDLYNRRYFELRLRQEMTRANRQKYQLFLMLIDVDNFKSFNDTQGHQVGDRVLQRLAKAINQSIRQDVDIGFRYGGDEFGVIAPQVTTEQAKMIAERIIDRFFTPDASKATSLSIGLAQMTHVDGLDSESPDDLIKRADDALFKSKNVKGDSIEILF